MKQSKIFRKPTVTEETRTQIKDLEQKEEISIQLEQNEERRIQKKNEQRFSHLWDNCKSSNI